MEAVEFNRRISLKKENVGIRLLVIFMRVIFQDKNIGSKITAFASPSRLLLRVPTYDYAIIAWNTIIQ